MAKQLISIRISDPGKIILDTLTERLGVTQAAIFEMALRELAKKEGVKVPATEQKKE